MNHVETIGRFLIRRRVGKRWMYARPERLGQLPPLARWTRHRSKAGRWLTRRSARRYVFRIGDRVRGTQIVEVSTWFGPLADGSPADLPHEIQTVFPFLESRAS